MQCIRFCCKISSGELDKSNICILPPGTPASDALAQWMQINLLRLILRLGRMFVFVPCTSLDTGTIFTALLSSKSAGSSFPTTIENGHSPEILRSFSLAQNILCVIVLSKRAAEISTWWISDWDHSYPSESRIEAFPLGDGKISAQKI